jgi:hypothetical protein
METGSYTLLRQLNNFLKHNYPLVRRLKLLSLIILSMSGLIYLVVIHMITSNDHQFIQMQPSALKQLKM